LRDAANANNLEVLRLLLAKGAEPNAKDENGERVLMAVVRYDYVECIQALLEAGADVKAVNADNETVLMRATQTDYRADPAARDRLLTMLIQS
jgi:ankyrin repeat protein